jgi:hypothetical protein
MLKYFDMSKICKILTANCDRDLFMYATICVAKYRKYAAICTGTTICYTNQTNSYMLISYENMQQKILYLLRRKTEPTPAAVHTALSLLERRAADACAGCADAVGAVADACAGCADPGGAVANAAAPALEEGDVRSRRKPPPSCRLEDVLLVRDDG